MAPTVFRTLLRRFTVMLLCLGSAMILGACNSLFYHPDRDLRMTPARLGLKFEETTVPVGKDPKNSYVHLWIVTPEGAKDAAPPPIIVHFHGNAENMTSHILFVAWLVKRGLSVVTFDYRGYGQSPGTPSRQSTVEDGVAVLDYIARRSEQDNLFVLGQSLGGAVAVAALASLPPEHPARRALRGLVLESTFASYRRLAEAKLAQMRPLHLAKVPLSYLVTDGSSAVDAIGNLSTVPLMQLHGDADEVVPQEQGRALFDAAAATAVPTAERQWINIPGGGHTPSFGWDASPYHDQLVAFLCRHTVGQKPRPACP